MKITINLDSKEIDNAIQLLNGFEKNLKAKGMELCERLGEVGITVAKANSPTYGSFIVFSQQIFPTGANQDSYTVMYARKTTDLIRRWYYKGGIKEVEIDPLLMEEFGSGFKAVNPLGISGVGQGTFPGQKHAFDPDGWSWSEPPRGVTFHSYGEAPGQPMYNAREAMILQIESIAREVFRDVV